MMLFKLLEQRLKDTKISLPDKYTKHFDFLPWQ